MTSEEELQFKKLWEETYRSKFIIALLKKVFPKERRMVDDFNQQTFLNAWEHRDKFKLGTNFKAWVCCIARNVARSYIRREWRIEYHAEIVDYANSISKIKKPQEWELFFKEITEQLNKVPPDLREALILVGSCGYSYEEAAKHQGCAVGTSKSRVARARQQLVNLTGYEGVGKSGRTIKPRDKERREKLSNRGSQETSY